MIEYKSGVTQPVVGIQPVGGDNLGISVYMWYYACMTTGGENLCMCHLIFRFPESVNVVTTLLGLSILRTKMW